MSTTRQLVVVANRLPVHRLQREGEDVWQTSPGGLVSALLPILIESKGTWIGWTGVVGPAPPPFDHQAIHNVPVPLSRTEVENYYEGFANRTLWPLYHDSVRAPEFRRRWWGPYVEINRRFAEAAADAATEGAIVWVQDYHLQLVPAMLRERRPDLRIGFFLHIHFPPQELFAQLPWRKPILEGLLGADVVGTQTPLGAQNFARLARRYTDAEDAEHAEDIDLRLRFRGRNVQCRAFPISIDVARFEQLAQDPGVMARAQHVRTSLGGRTIVLGVDRLDYTKGIDIRLRAYRELLRSGRLLAERCVLVQTAVPSREHVDDYAELRRDVEQLVGEINGEFGQIEGVAVHYLRQNLAADELTALYVAADVMLVTPLRDGMNLVCKEFVASRIDATGVLVLSEFTGAARELTDALLVNPHDIAGLAASIDAAVHMPAEEQARRMRAMRQAIHRNDVFHWARGFLAALEP